MQTNPAPYYTNISELRKRPTKIIDESQGELVAIFNHGDLVSYLVAPDMLEKLLEIKADIDTLNEI